MLQMQWPLPNPILGWRAETLDEYGGARFINLLHGLGQGPTLIVDDGGEATLMVHWVRNENERQHRMDESDEGDDFKRCSIALNKSSGILKNRIGLPGLLQVSKGCQKRNKT
jgi:adenosylhomocysteinase